MPWELLLILLVLVVAAVAVQQARPEQEAPPPPDLASDSIGPGGARALYLWLQSLDYRVERLEHREFQPDEATETLLLMAPTTQMDRKQLTTLRNWVESGGILIVAGDNKFPVPKSPAGGPSLWGEVLPAVLREFGLVLRSQTTEKAEVEPTQPLLLRPVVSRARVETSTYVTGSTNLIPYLGDPERPVAAGLTAGKGRVYVLASSYALSNQGLGEADNGALLLNWLPAPGGARAVVFDEIHHGRSEPRSFTYVLLHEPWGWAGLYALGIVFLYLLLGGRRFGRAVPSVADTRRVAAEHVISLAGLLRRGGARAWAARHYERTLRQRLVAAGGLDPEIDTAGAAARLSQLDRLAGGVAGRDAGQVLLDLHDGANKGISEGRLVRLAVEADRIIKACSGRRQ